MNVLLALDAALVALALLVTTAPWPASVIERWFANGWFAALNRALVPAANLVPFAIGDIAIALAVVVPVASWIVVLRRARRERGRTALRLAAHTVGFVAFVVLAFELSWGLNYHRAGYAARVAYDPQRIDAANVSRFADRIIGILNDDVVAAHAIAASESPAATRAQLARDFAPLATRLGDTWPVAVTVPKTTVADRFYEMAGIGGQYDPWTFETLLIATFLPFEWPRALAHEWAHVAGFGNEGDANVIGSIACLRSPNALIRYSGAYWLYGELPDADRARVPLVPAVAADIRAGNERFRRYYQPHLFQISWRIYDTYLKSNGVQGGVVSYSNDLRLLVGTTFDAAGLPRAR